MLDPSGRLRCSRVNTARSLLGVVALSSGLAARRRRGEMGAAPLLPSRNVRLVPRMEQGFNSRGTGTSNLAVRYREQGISFRGNFFTRKGR